MIAEPALRVRAQGFCDSAGSLDASQNSTTVLFFECDSRMRADEKRTKDEHDE
jgi:hypothetical protein